MSDLNYFGAYVTDVTGYEFMMTAEYEYGESAGHEVKTSDEFLRELQSETEETVEMALGTLGHKWLEISGPGEEVIGIRDKDKPIGLLFDFDAVIPVMPETEMRVMREWEIGGDRVCLRGRVDAHNNRRVVDYKFQGDFDTVKLWDSFQWMAYFAMLPEQYDEFEYSVFVRGKKPMWKKSVEAFVEKWYKDAPPKTREHLEGVAKSAGTVNWYKVRAHESLVLYRSPGIEDAVRSRLYAFWEWSKRVGWEGRSPREDGSG